MMGSAIQWQIFDGTKLIQLIWCYSCFDISVILKLKVRLGGSADCAVQCIHFKFDKDVCTSDSYAYPSFYLIPKWLGQLLYTLQLRTDLNRDLGIQYRTQTIMHRVFFLGGTGGVPPIRRKFCQSPPSDTCPRFWTKACPPPAEVCPRKFEKFKYIFVWNLTTFKLKSTLKSCISCLK